jgi:hypothetical protein
MPMLKLSIVRPEGNNFVLATYIDQAMELAVYEIIEDDKLYWGEIPGLQGVWERHATLEGCRRSQVLRVKG